MYCRFTQRSLLKLPICFNHGQFAGGAKNLQDQCAVVTYLVKKLVDMTNLAEEFRKKFRSNTFCSCCSAYLSSSHSMASDTNLLDNAHTFHYIDYFMIGGIRTCLGVSYDPMFLWISSNSCPLNLLLVRSHQGEIIIVKHLIQEHNSMTRVRVEPRPFDQGHRKNDAFTHSATLQTIQYCQLLRNLCHYLDTK